MILKFELNRYGVRALISHFCIMTFRKATFMNDTKSCKIPKCDFF